MDEGAGGNRRHPIRVLRTQYRDAVARLNVALEAGQVESVLALLDDTTSSANEAIHALVSAVYAGFVPNADLMLVVPEYLTTLKRALMVRRGTAQLADMLQSHNDILQREDAAKHAQALAAILKAVDGFVHSEAWHAMRASDRWEIAQFDSQLRQATPEVAPPIAEGFVKYLESLGAINEREVLVQHDQRVLGELHETIRSARALLDVSPTMTRDLLLKACQTARALRGRRPALDRLLTPTRAAR